jgi:uncharacterized protein YjbI with pentapeptide repeats
MADAVLDSAILNRARFVRTKLNRASMQDVQASRTVWHLSDLCDASLNNATLEEADMIGANLTGADFRGASMRAAKLDRTEQKDLKMDSSARAVLGAANESYAEFVLETA